MHRSDRPRRGRTLPFSDDRFAVGRHPTTLPQAPPPRNRGNPAGRLYEAQAFRKIGERPAYYRSRGGARHDAVSYERAFD